MPPEFEWDEEKNRANRRKHGISLKEASAIFDGPVFTALDEREDYGEQRLISIGWLSHLVVVVVAHNRPRRANPADLGPQGQPRREAGLL